MSQSSPCILVIFGASGDLTKRKLVPALFDLYRQKLLPERFAVLGVSRSEYSDDAFRTYMLENVRKYHNGDGLDEALLKRFIAHLYYQAIDTNDAAAYATLKTRLDDLNDERQTGGNYIYYLSTPPSLYDKIPRYLGAHDLQVQGEGQGWKRLIIEKPFGYDLASAGALNRTIQQIFGEEQIYRIDHYLGKETVQNMLVFRFSNGIFEPLWNRNYIHHVEITAAEFIGVENRGRYYDHSGALRDMVQNHLMQVLGMVAMEPPSRISATGVRNETVKVFDALRVYRPEEVSRYVVRGQYTASTVRGEAIPGYREEADIPADSRTETFVAVKAFIDNWRWGGVPFFIRTGKRLPTRVTEVVIHFKKTPHHLFTENDQCDVSCNQLILRIQPDEGILVKFGMKLPGAGFQIRNVNMDFHYSDLTDAYIPSAYERLLLDCILGDATLYARADAVEAGWKFVDPILRAWQERPEIQVFGYPAGTWGPRETQALFDEPGDDWRYPCANLANDGEYCEL